MTGDENKALELLIAEVRGGFENMPVIETEDDFRTAEALMVALARGLSAELQHAVGREVFLLINARIGAALQLAKMRARDR